MASVRYGDANGSTAAAQPILTYGSSDRGHHVQPEEGDAEQRERAVQLALAAWPAPAAPSRAGPRRPSTTTALNATSSASPLPRETNHSACDPPSTVTCPSRRPIPGVDVAARGSPAAAARWRPGQPPRHADPAVVADQPGRDARPRPASSPPAAPATIAAVAAAFASAQVAAATLAVRHGPSAGSPVAGPRCDAAPCRRAATAGRSPTRWRPPRRPAGQAAPSAPAWSGSSATVTGQPPRGGVPATAMSPPRLTSAPPCCPAADMTARTARSAPTPLAVAPRSSRMPGGSRSSGPSSRTSCQPGAGTGAPGGPPSGSMAAKSRS